MLSLLGGILNPSQMLRNRKATSQASYSFWREDLRGGEDRGMIYERDEQIQALHDLKYRCSLSGCLPRRSSDDPSLSWPTRAGPLLSCPSEPHLSGILHLLRTTQKYIKKKYFSFLALPKEYAMSPYCILISKYWPARPPREWQSWPFCIGSVTWFCWQSFRITSPRRQASVKWCCTQQSYKSGCSDPSWTRKGCIPLGPSQCSAPFTSI